MRIVLAILLIGCGGSFQPFDCSTAYVCPGATMTWESVEPVMYNDHMAWRQCQSAKCASFKFRDSVFESECNKQLDTWIRLCE